MFVFLLKYLHTYIFIRCVSEEMYIFFNFLEFWQACAFRILKIQNCTSPKSNAFVIELLKMINYAFLNIILKNCLNAYIKVICLVKTTF